MRKFRLAGNIFHGVVSSPALQRRVIRGWSPRRLRHLQFLPTQRRDRTDQPLGDGLVERNGGHRKTGTRRDSLPMLPEALVHRINAAVSPLAYGQPAAAIAAQK